jgi:hypothetical protein
MTLFRTCGKCPADVSATMDKADPYTDTSLDRAVKEMALAIGCA